MDTKEMLEREVDRSLHRNMDTVNNILYKNSDLIKRRFSLQEGEGTEGVIYYIDGLSNNQLIDETLLRPLVIDSITKADDRSRPSVSREAKQMANNLVINPEIKVVRTIEKAIDGLLSGESLIFIDGFDEALLAGTKGWESRPPGETATEVIIRGPRDGFTENIRTNTSLIRRRIKDPMFRLESLQLGERTKTAVNVAYIEGIAKASLVDEVMKRLNRIQIDSVLESGYIEELIEDSPLSPFTTVRSTERPDTVAAHLLEGRVAILVDTTPFALIVPTYFWDGLIASDDYYSRYYIGTFSRIVRAIAFVVSLTLSSIYVMLVSFHQEMIPTPLALSVAAGRESVPFPVLVEILLMETAFELMREAGLRMPRPIGQAVSIVGSLIIGQAAVQAGLVSPIMVIIVAVTGISSFAIPSYSTSFTIRFLRFPILLASGTFGLLGFSGVIFILMVHMLSLRSFGEAYLSPVVPIRPSDQKDNLVRFPWWTMKKRPWATDDAVRQGDHQKPVPPQQGSGQSDSMTPNQDDTPQPKQNRETEEDTVTQRFGRKRGARERQKRRPRKMLRGT